MERNKHAALNWANRDDDYRVPPEWNHGIPEPFEHELQVTLFSNLEAALAKKVKVNPALEKSLNYYVSFNTNDIVRDLRAIIEAEGEPDREVIKSYLRDVLSVAEQLPKYLVDAESNRGKTDLFARIRQEVQVCEREEFERKQKEREEMRGSHIPFVHSNTTSSGSIGIKR